MLLNEQKEQKELNRVMDKLKYGIGKKVLIEQNSDVFECKLNYDIKLLAGELVKQVEANGSLECITNNYRNCSFIYLSSFEKDCCDPFIIENNNYGKKIYNEVLYYSTVADYFLKDLSGIDMHRDNTYGMDNNSILVDFENYLNENNTMISFSNIAFINNLFNYNNRTLIDTLKLLRYIELYNPKVINNPTKEEKISAKLNKFVISDLFNLEEEEKTNNIYKTKYEYDLLKITKPYVRKREK